MILIQSMISGRKSCPKWKPYSAFESLSAELLEMICVHLAGMHDLWLV